MPELVAKPVSEKGRHRTLTVTAAKGGIGKTTTTVQIAYPMAQFGIRVLLIDLDANAGLTTILDSHDDGPGAVEFLDDVNIDQDECVRRPEAWQPDADIEFAEGGALIAGGCVDIIPASGGIAESVGKQDARAVKRLRNALIRDDFILDRYDIAMIDIPGADNAVVDLALQASHNLVLPLLPESQGFRGFSRTVARVKDMADEGVGFSVVGAVTSRYEKNRNEHKDVLRGARKFVLSKLGPEIPWLGLPVPSRSTISDANRSKSPLARRNAWRDTVSNRTRSMDAIAAYSAIAIAIIREVVGGDRADEIVEAIKESSLAEFPKTLLLSGVGVEHEPQADDNYTEAGLADSAKEN